MRGSGLLRFARNDERDTRSRSRGVFRPSLASSITLFKKQRAQGRPGGRCTRGRRAKKLREERVNHRNRRDQPGLPCAVVYGLYELSPVNQRLPPSSARSLWSLATTWRLHGRARTTRLRRPRMRRSSHGTSLVHRIPLHVRDDAYAPDRTGMRRPYNGLRFRKSRMFFACRIDKVFGRALVGQISSTADLEQGAVMLQCSKLV